MRRERGFTLIEVMVALTILGFMMAIAWGTTDQTLKAKRRYERLQDRYREVRIALSRMSRDFSMAYLSGNEDRSLLEPRTFFIGESNADIDAVRFSALAHSPLYANANESDQTIIAYYGASDPDDRSRMNLVRKELARPPHPSERWDQVPGTAEVILSGVTRLELAYFDAWPERRDWQETWSTQNTDGNPPRVPDRVRIKLSLLDERNKEVTFVTEVRVHLQETLQFFAN